MEEQRSDTSTGTENSQDLEARVKEAIKTVYDPEIPVDVYELGLIYELNVLPDDSVFVKMTLTTVGCPAAEFLPQQVEDAIRNVPGVTGARVELTFDPPFHRDMMSEAAKLELGFL